MPSLLEAATSDAEKILNLVEEYQSELDQAEIETYKKILIEMNERRIQALQDPIAQQKAEKKFPQFKQLLNEIEASTPHHFLVEVVRRTTPSEREREVFLKLEPSVVNEAKKYQGENVEKKKDVFKKIIGGINLSSPNPQNVMDAKEISTTLQSATTLFQDERGKDFLSKINSALKSDEEKYEDQQKQEQQQERRSDAAPLGQDREVLSTIPKSPLQAAIADAKDILALVRDYKAKVVSAEIEVYKKILIEMNEERIQGLHKKLKTYSEANKDSTEESVAEEIKRQQDNIHVHEQNFVQFKKVLNEITEVNDDDMRNFLSEVVKQTTVPEEEEDRVVSELLEYINNKKAINAGYLSNEGVTKKINLLDEIITKIDSAVNVEKGKQTFLDIDDMTKLLGNLDTALLFKDKEGSVFLSQAEDALRDYKRKYLSYIMHPDILEAMDKSRDVLDTMKQRIKDYRQELLESERRSPQYENALKQMYKDVILQDMDKEIKEKHQSFFIDMKENMKDRCDKYMQGEMASYGADMMLEQIAFIRFGLSEETNIYSMSKDTELYKNIIAYMDHIKDSAQQPLLSLPLQKRLNALREIEAVIKPFITGIATEEEHKYLIMNIIEDVLEGKEPETKRKESKARAELMKELRQDKHFSKFVSDLLLDIEKGSDNDDVLDRISQRIKNYRQELFESERRSPQYENALKQAYRDLILQDIGKDTSEKTIKIRALLDKHIQGEMASYGADMMLEDVALVRFGPSEEETEKTNIDRMSEDNELYKNIIAYMDRIKDSAQQPLPSLPLQKKLNALREIELEAVIKPFKSKIVPGENKFGVINIIKDVFAGRETAHERKESKDRAELMKELKRDKRFSKFVSDLRSDLEEHRDIVDSINFQDFKDFTKKESKGLDKMISLCEDYAKIAGGDKKQAVDEFIEYLKKVKDEVKKGPSEFGFTRYTKIPSSEEMSQQRFAARLKDMEIKLEALKLKLEVRRPGHAATFWNALNRVMSFLRLGPIKVGIKGAALSTNLYGQFHKQESVLKRRQETFEHYYTPKKPGKN